jgi:polyphosphate kinase
MAETAVPPEDRDLEGSRYLNRELSWLDFNERVLTLAEGASLPLLERVKFLAIYESNLDEFFQVRVSGLREQAEAGVSSATPEGLTPGEQLAAIARRVQQLTERVTKLLTTELLPLLAQAGIRIVGWDELDGPDRSWATTEFLGRIFPVLTPLSVDPAHPFPYISSLSINLSAIARDPTTHERRFVRVKVPPLLPRFLRIGSSDRFVPLEQVIAGHLEHLFPGMEVVSHHVFRVTRDADLDVEEDEADDLLAAIQTVLHRRQRGALPVRLQVDGTMEPEVRELLLRELDLEPSDLYETPAIHDQAALASLVEMDRPDLKLEPWVPVPAPALREGEDRSDLFAILRDRDVLVHHPYESFVTSVEAFIEQAAHDPRVLAIKQTLYRTSVDSPIVRALIAAAEAGKQVVALVELKARFDEQANIDWARALEEAGVHVVYGIVGLKTHAKVCLVVRRERGGIRRYAHVGTGNYNPITAAAYEDLGLLTADTAIGTDLTDLFNMLTGYSRQRDYRELLVAPLTLRHRITELIEREAGHHDGWIVLKMNSLVDVDVIDALYAAARAGTRIDLLVRGICCLRPGVAGLSEGIRVRSIVGRFLEHSRIFRFGTPERGFEHYVGSADLMPRNLDHRVEAALPVTAPELRSRLDEILDLELANDVLAWELDAEARWRRVGEGTDGDVQQRLMTLAKRRAVTTA